MDKNPSHKNVNESYRKTIFSKKQKDIVQKERKFWNVENLIDQAHSSIL